MSSSQVRRAQAPLVQSKLGGQSASPPHAVAMQRAVAASHEKPSAHGEVSPHPVVHARLPSQLQAIGSQIIAGAPQSPSVSQLLGSVLQTPQPAGVPGGAHTVPSVHVSVAPQHIACGQPRSGHGDGTTSSGMQPR